MKQPFTFTLVLICLVSSIRCAEITVTAAMMNMTVHAMDLTYLSYSLEPDSSGYDTLTNFNDEPEQATFAEKDGYCYVAFRGSTNPADDNNGLLMVAIDWLQNIDNRKEEICNEDTCCTVHRGYYSAYYADYTTTLEESVRACAQGCADPDECVVFTGHSQGGAVANIAAIAMADLNPYVITFGQPPVFASSCDAISTDRVYRYINTVERKFGFYGLTYDAAPFLPYLRYESFGHEIVLGNSAEDIAYLGLDSNIRFPFRPITGLSAHSKNAYLEKISEMANKEGTLPVSFLGFSTNHPCTKNEECKSGTCDKKCS